MEWRLKSVRTMFPIWLRLQIDSILIRHPILQASSPSERKGLRLNCVLGCVALQKKGNIVSYLRLKPRRKLLKLLVKRHPKVTFFPKYDFFT
jgi:hypothetical protein